MKKKTIKQLTDELKSAKIFIAHLCNKEAEMIKDRQLSDQAWVETLTDVIKEKKELNEMLDGIVNSWQGLQGTMTRNDIVLVPMNANKFILAKNMKEIKDDSKKVFN